ENVLKIAAQVVDDAGDKIVGQWPGRRHPFDAAVDASRLEDADDDGKTAVALHLFQHDDLLIVNLADDDALQFHLDGHRQPLFHRTVRPAATRSGFSLLYEAL